MVELQLLNQILKKHDLSIVRKNGIPKDYFIQYIEEFEFIDNHCQKYGDVPDVATFLAKFPDFEIIEVNETDKYLITTLQEQYTYSKMVPYVKKIAELCQTDSNDAVDYARTELEVIKKLSNITKPGIDIIQSYQYCADEYKRRIEQKGLLGISSGLTSIDEATHGWVYPDVIGIVGRLNEGKSWLLFWFLINAWTQGKSILLYSGEMDVLMLQMRLAALHGHFSNMGIMGGKEDLANGKTFQDFFTYARELTNNKTPFIVLTPKDLKDSKLTIPELINAIELHNPDIIGIDQISLMEDYRATRGQQPRIGFTHITEDLFSISEKYQIPVILAAQAGRDAARESKKDGAKPPDVEQVSESDGIAQNLSRMLTIKQDGDRLLVCLRKNRYGMKNQEWKLKWNIDTGDIGFIDSPQVVNSKGESIKQPYTGAEMSMSGEELF